jgi:hypothetical protein
MASALMTATLTATPLDTHDRQWPKWLLQMATLNTKWTSLHCAVNLGPSTQISPVGLPRVVMDVLGHSDIGMTMNTL